MHLKDTVPTIPVARPISDCPSSSQDFFSDSLCTPGDVWDMRTQLNFRGQSLSARLGMYCERSAVLLFLAIVSGCPGQKDSGSASGTGSGSGSGTDSFSRSHVEVKQNASFAFQQAASGNQERLDIYRVSIPITFTAPDKTTWTAPASTLTDWASVPDSLLSAMGRPDGEKVARAALIHDAYCQEFLDPAHPPAEKQQCFRTRTWQATHQMFYDACIACGASPLAAYGWWLGVYVGGPRWDVQGKTVKNDLNPVSSEAVYAMLYGSDGQLRSAESLPSKTEMEQKLEKFEIAAAAAGKARDSAVSLVKAGKLDESGQAVQEASDKLVELSKSDAEGQVVYAALQGNLHKDVGRALDEGSHSALALEQYARAASAFDDIRQRAPLEASGTAGVAAVNRWEAIAHSKLNQPDLAIKKLDAADAEVVRLKQLAPQSRIPTSLGEQIKSTRETIK